MKASRAERFDIFLSDSDSGWVSEGGFRVRSYSFVQRLVRYFIAERSKVITFLLLFLSSSFVVRMRGIGFWGVGRVGVVDPLFLGFETLIFGFLGEF